ncbi:MAG: carboxy-S-adenosyl-L-methionine synthase CmoA, partial [Ketobacter sp.]
IQSVDSIGQARVTDWHHEFKRLNGYSDLEISQKRQAIENVLVPETRQGHQQRLRAAGFSEVYCWFQCFNFASLVAIK